MDTLHLRVWTLESLFLDARIRSVSLYSKTGSLTILPGHLPMLASFLSGEILVNIDGVHKAFLSVDGFMEVTEDEVVIFTRMAVWENDAEIQRSVRKKREAVEQMRSQKSIAEHKHLKIKMARTLYEIRKPQKNRNF